MPVKKPNTRPQKFAPEVSKNKIVREKISGIELSKIH